MHLENLREFFGDSERSIVSSAVGITESTRCRRRGLPLLVLLLPRHGRVRLHLALPPRRDDPALQRRMRESSETVGRADVCQQAFHTPSVLGNHVASGRERGRPTRPPSSPVGQAFNAFCVVTSTVIRWGLAVSAFGSVIVSTPRSQVALILFASIEADSRNVRSKAP